ncbi:FAD binding domain-containing protein [Apiospora kogelbergensis]|uniref:FAD binding domain-containing protein n=1 Tax=Apiospora kogelbergensis TaxID=1337665 RepID=UPI00312DD6CC
MSQMHTHLLIALEKQNETMEAINDTLKFGQVPGKKGPHDYKAWVRRQYTATVEESVEILDCLLRRWKAGVQRSPPAYITEANASMLRGGATCFCHLHELDKNLAQTLMRSFFREVYGIRFGAATLCGQPMLHPQSVKSSNDGAVFELRASYFEMGYIFAEEDQANPLAAQKRFQSAFPACSFTDSLKFSHSPFLSMPAKVAATLFAQAAQSAQKSAKSLLASASAQQ